jgi:hypothetical protein
LPRAGPPGSSTPTGAITCSSAAANAANAFAFRLGTTHVLWGGGGAWQLAIFASPAMPRQKGDRNSTIVRLLRSGGRPSTIANQFNVSPGRVTQIVAANDAIDRLRAVLQKKYGARPNIRQLGDQTPIEALILCEADMHGWAVRVKSLRQAATPIKRLATCAE